MTQWAHAQPKDCARAKRFFRAATLVVVLGVALGAAMFCAGAAAAAETYTPHTRHITARYTTAHYVTHHTRTRGSVTGAHARRVASNKDAVESNRRVRGRSARFEPVREAVPSRRNSARERRAARSGEPALRRVSVRRRRGGRRHSERIDVVAETPKDPSAAETADAQTVAPASDKGLTVNDFVRAASAQNAPGAGVYASGVSHPDEDVSLAETRAAVAMSRAAAQPAVTASVEAAPEREPAPLQRSAPSDLAGAPLAARGHDTARDEPRSKPVDADAEIAPATHEELAEEVEQPVVLPGLYRYGRLVVPPPMRGTREILVHQNLIADEEGLSRIQDDDDLRRMRAQRMLVDFPESASLRVNPELASDRRCARPWTVHFATEIARAYYARFHESLQVNSAVRTVAYQLRLRRVNGNAAGIGGDMASPHLTGEALDFGKRDMSTAEIAWMRTYLRPLMQDGKVDVEEEFQQACFHISVYRAYAPDLPGTRRHAYTRSELAQLHAPHVSRTASHVDLEP
jgi:Family of unknown function (DUF5715)